MAKDSADAQSAFSLVRRLCCEWPSLTQSDFYEMLTPDCLYINMPMPERRCIGPDQSFNLIAAFVAGWKTELRMIHIRGDGEVVLTERLERFESRFRSISGRGTPRHGCI